MSELEDSFARATTDRLLLRRPTGSDLDAVFAVHSDPATNRYNPACPDADLAASSLRLDEWLVHWAEHGFGYWTVLTLAEQEIVGFAGLRHGTWLDLPILNLYYRFSPAAWGHRYATEAARHALALAGRHFPALPVLARTKGENRPSQRTALAAGLTRRPDFDRDDGTGPAVIFVTHWPAQR